MVGIARAADDRQLRIFLPQLARHAKLLHRIVHCQHDRFGMFEAKSIETAGARNVGEAHCEAVAPRRSDGVDIGVDRNIGACMLAEQFGDRATDPPETDDDGASGRLFLGFAVAALHLDPPCDVVAGARQQRGDRQADCRDELPEFGRGTADELRLERGRQNDQRGLGRAGHEQADFGRGPAART